MSTLSRIYGLDLIRGVAIFLVLLRHAWPEIFGGAGIVGVVVFFALSGYLITGNLSRDIERNGSVRFGRFYAHRGLRLMPPLLLVLGGFASIEGIWNILGDRSEIIRSVVVGLTYTMNVPGFDHGSSALSHLWTLATEEQFYLLWPLVLMLGVKWGRPGAVTIVATFGVTFLCAATLFVADPVYGRVYTLPTSWFVCMLIGALAYLKRDSFARIFQLRGRARALPSTMAMAILVAISLGPDPKGWAATYLFLGPIISLCSVALIFEFSRWRGPIPTALKPLQGLGLISYAAYLWNYPIATWMGERPLSFVEGAATIVLTLVAATFSWFAVERPAAGLRVRFDAWYERTHDRPHGVSEAVPSIMAPEDDVKGKR